MPEVLPAYTVNMHQALMDGYQSSQSPKLTNLFCSSLVGIEGEKINLTSGPADVIINGGTYHRLLDVTRGEHHMHWFLYDEAYRPAKLLNST